MYSPYTQILMLHHTWRIAEYEQGSADTVHTTNPPGPKHWIRKLWPSGELVDKVG